MTDAALSRRAASRAAAETPLAKATAIGISLAFLAVFFLAPLVVVVVEAASKGLAGYIDAITEPDARAAILSTLTVAAFVASLNAAFGLAAAWAIAKVRKDLRKWLREIHDRTGLTTVFVTHDQAEAMDIADRVAILNAGRIEQIGSPAELRAAPATPFVRAFLE